MGLEGDDGLLRGKGIRASRQSLCERLRDSIDGPTLPADASKRFRAVLMRCSTEALNHIIQNLNNVYNVYLRGGGSIVSVPRKEH